MCIFPQIWIWWVSVFDHSQNRTFLFEVMGIKTINDSPPPKPLYSWLLTEICTFIQPPIFNTHKSHFHLVQVSATKRREEQLWIYQRDRTQATGLSGKTGWLRSWSLVTVSDCWGVFEPPLLTLTSFTFVAQKHPVGWKIRAAHTTPSVCTHWWNCEHLVAVTLLHMVFVKNLNIPLCTVSLFDNSEFEWLMGWW